MPRAAKPRALKILEGNPGRRPIEPEVPFKREPPVKPEGLSPDASWMWDEIVFHMQDMNLLKPVDGASLRMLCETFARWKEAVRMRQEEGLLATTSQGRNKAPWINIEENASRDFRAWCAEYGITPATEKNLAGKQDAPGDENPFA
jgi:P27 family predicted phage terminase small subunit